MILSDCNVSGAVSPTVFPEFSFLKKVKSKMGHLFLRMRLIKTMFFTHMKKTYMSLQDLEASCFRPWTWWLARQRECFRYLSCQLYLITYSV